MTRLLTAFDRSTDVSAPLRQWLEYKVEVSHLFLWLNRVSPAQKASTSRSSTSDSLGGEKLETRFRRE
jgi:hypothetical protein